MSEERDGVSMSDQTEDAATQAIAGIIIRDVLQEEYDDLVEGYLEEILIASRRIMRLPAYAEVGKLFRERLDDAITYRDARIAALEGEVERLHQGLRVRGMRINSQAAVDDALAAIDEWKANADRWGGEVERLRIQYNSACETVVAQAFALKRQDALANLEREG